jgi:hypothetical protein
MVVGGGVCPMHGGRAKHVEARRQQRILLYEAEAQAKAAPFVEPEPELSADEILISLLRDVRRTFEHVKAGLVSNSDPSQLATWLAVMGEWADRLDRISRSAIVTNAEARVAQRRVAVTEAQVATLVTAMHLGVTSSDLTARQRVEVVETVLEAIQNDNLPLIGAETIQQWMMRMRREAAAELVPELEAGPLDDGLDDDLADMDEAV